jgi:multidrug efflux pump subunit AcrA (membrane-fusion protein)
MKRLSRLTVFCCALLAAPLLAQEPKPAPKTHTVARGPLKIEITLDASLEAAHASEVSVAPEEAAQLVVKEAIPHGSRVTKGQVIVQLDPRKLAEQIRDQESARALAELSLKQEKQDLEILTKAAPLDTQLAERTKRIADEDLTLFEQVERPFDDKAQAERLKQAEQYLEYTQEELKQLEKMYKADDLTEETEEIILKRARNDVEQMKFMVEQTRHMHEQYQKVQSPRMLDSHKHAAEQAAIIAEKARVSLPMLIAKQRLAIEKLEFEQAKSAEQLARLKSDLDRLAIKAPADGIVYYGRWLAGKWSGAAEMQQKLRPGGQVAPHEVLLTIVEPGNLLVRASVPEKDYAQVKVGAAGQLVPKSEPDRKLDVKVREVSAAPVAEGQFAATLDLAGDAASLTPGMTGQVKVTSYYKPDALLVPAKSVFTDDLDEEQKYVLVLLADGKHERRNVKIAKATEKWAEVATGLAEGDKVLLEKPAE